MVLISFNYISLCRNQGRDQDFVLRVVLIFLNIIYVFYFINEINLRNKECQYGGGKNPPNHLLAGTPIIKVLSTIHVYCIQSVSWSDWILYHTFDTFVLFL